MKKVRVLLSALAMVFAVAAAFAFNSKPTVASAFFRVDPVTGVITEPYTQVSSGHWCEQSAEKCKRMYETNPNGTPVIPLQPLADAVPGTYNQ